MPIIDVQMVFNAVTYSSIVALAATGLTTTFLTTKVPNFAQGSFMMVGAYTAIYVALKWGWSPYAALPLSALLGAAVGLAVYFLVIYPLRRRGANIMALMVATLAVSIVFIGVMNIVADVFESAGVRSRDIGLSFLDYRERIGPLIVRGVYMVTPIFAAAIVFALFLLLNYTKIGIAFRATVENPELARVMGVNVDMVMALSWALSGMLGAVSGTFLPIFLRIAHPNIGDDMLPTIFAASVVGGLQSIYGGFIGGYIVGLAETIVTRLLGEVVQGALVYRYVVSMAIFVAVLVFAPRGVIGLIKEGGRRA